MDVGKNLRTTRFFEHKLPNMINVFNSYKFPNPNLFKF